MYHDRSVVFNLWCLCNSFPLYNVFFLLLLRKQFESLGKFVNLNTGLMKYLLGFMNTVNNFYIFNYDLKNNDSSRK